MKKLSEITEKTSVFILEIETDKKNQERLYSLGVLPAKIITVMKNPQNNSPLIIEVDESRFAISRDIAQEITVNHVLDGQDFIFDAQHKKTEQRAFILKELKRQKEHFSLNDFTAQLRKKDSKIGTITVYRTLKLLTEKGILEILTLPDGTKMFEIKKGHHDHIICENCSSIIEFHNEEMERLQEEIAEKHQIELDSHKVKLFAKTCPKCKK